MSEEFKRLNVQIPSNLHKELKVTVALQGKTLSQWIIEAIQEKMRQESNTENSRGLL